MYSLIALFLCLPLYFSHIFAPFGMIIGNSSSFERQKVYLLLFLVLICLFEMLLRNSAIVLERIEKYSKYIIVGLLFPIISSYWWGSELNNHFFFGSHEKQHGYIWYILLLLLGILLSTLNTREKKILVSASMVSSLVAAIFSIIEYFSGGSPFFSQSGIFSWGSARSVSTLGNPNYVAGYLLMNIVFFDSLRSPERWIYALILSIGIFATGSYIGFGILALFIVYRAMQYVLPRGQSAFVACIVGVLGCSTVYHFISSDKLLSFESRFILMGELWTNMVQYPFSFLFGFGPESIISYFSGDRSEIINSYFPITSAIDSSHNIFLDFLFQYGGVPLILFGYIILKKWKNIHVHGQEGLILGCIFLSFNVTITAHVIMLILLVFLTLSSQRQERH